MHEQRKIVLHRHPVGKQVFPRRPIFVTDF